VKDASGGKAVVKNNLAEPFVPSQENLVNYSIDFQGDAETGFISGFQGAEKRFGGMRWSGETAKIELPVLPDTEYTLSLYLHVPKYALSEDAGIYAGDKCLIPLDKEQDKTLSAKVKTGKNQKTLPLDVRVKGWRPIDNLKGSGDYRTLGIGVMQVKMESKQGAKIFNFNRKK
jgi:hypothetical protein